MAEKSSSTKCIYRNIFQELRLRDQEEFQKNLRMNTDTYMVIFNIFYEWHLLLGLK